MVRTLIGNKYGIYIASKNDNAYVEEQQCTNIHDVNLDGVNHVVIRRFPSGGMKVIQASGYMPDRGIFVDLY